MHITYIHMNHRIIKNGRGGYMEIGTYLGDYGILVPMQARGKPRYDCMYLLM